MWIKVEAVCQRCLAPLSMQDDRLNHPQLSQEESMILRRSLRAVTCTVCKHENPNVRFYVEIASYAAL